MSQINTRPYIIQHTKLLQLAHCQKVSFTIDAEAAIIEGINQLWTVFLFSSMRLLDISSIIFGSKYRRGKRTLPPRVRDFQNPSSERVKGNCSPSQHVILSEIAVL